MTFRIFTIFIFLFTLRNAVRVTEMNKPTGCTANNNRLEEWISKYENGDNRLSGGYAGTVYNIPEQDVNLVMKHFKILDIDKLKICQTEVDIMRNLDELKHDNAIPYETKRNLVSISSENGCYYKNDNVYIFMEKFNGDLLKLIKENPNGIEKNILWKMSTSLLLALTIVRFQSLGYIHGDIKFQNFLVRSPFEIYLTDYSLTVKDNINNEINLFDTPDEKFTKMQKHNILLPEERGTPGYMGPEIIESHKIYKGSDIYALGIMIYQLFMDGKIINDINYTINTKCLNFNPFNELNERYYTWSHIIYCTYYDHLVKMMIYEDPELRPIDNKLIDMLQNMTEEALSDYLDRLKKLNASIQNYETKKAAEPRSYNNLGGFIKQSFKKIGEKVNILLNEEEIVNNQKEYLKRNSIETFLDNLVNTLNERKNLDMNYKRSVIKDYYLFFKGLDDEGASLLGCDIDNYYENECDPRDYLPTNSNTIFQGTTTKPHSPPEKKMTKLIL